MSVDSVLKDLLFCPICLEFMNGEICQCFNGHLICSACESKTEKCPKCDYEFTTKHIRNIGIECLRNHMIFTCENKGCNNKVSTFKEHEEHKTKCRFYKCSNVGCEIRGTHQELKQLHENVCGYRMMECVICETRLACTDMKKHMTDVHNTKFEKFKPGQNYNPGIPIGTRYRRSMLFIELLDKDFIAVRVSRNDSSLTCEVIAFTQKTYKLYNSIIYYSKISGLSDIIPRHDPRWTSKTSLDEIRFDIYDDNPKILYPQEMLEVTININVVK